MRRKRLPRAERRSVQFARALVLSVACAAVVVPVAVAMGFADAPCIEDHAGVRVCPAGAVGQFYAIKLEGRAGCGPDPNVPGSGLPYQFRVLAGPLPPGLSLRKDGLLSGTPGAAGTWSFWLEISDEDPPSASWCIPKKSERQFTLHVGAPPGEVGAPYAVALGTSGKPPQMWSIDSGQLPPGLALDASAGVVAGTPAAAGRFSVGLVSVDGRRHSRRVDLMISVSPALTFATTQLAPARVRSDYRSTMRTRGGLAPVRFHVRSGRFPAGLRLNVETGLITGRPRQAGVYRFTIEARDTVGGRAIRTFVLTVRRQLT